MSAVLRHSSFTHRRAVDIWHVREFVLSAQKNNALVCGNGKSPTSGRETPSSQFGDSVSPRTMTASAKNRTLRTALLSVILLHAGLRTDAATFTWSGAGANNLWSTTANWGGTAPANNGTAGEGLQVYWTSQTAVPCAAALVAGPSGIPASCVSPVFVGGSSPLEFRTYNTPGTPWGASPAYSAEVDVLQF